MPSLYIRLSFQGPGTSSRLGIKFATLAVTTSLNSFGPLRGENPTCVYRTALEVLRPPPAMKPCSLRPNLATAALRRRGPLSRRYAVQAPGAPTLEIFNQRVKHLQKERAASNTEQSRKVDYLRDEVAQRLSERLLVNFNLLLFTQSPQWIAEPQCKGHQTAFPFGSGPWSKQLEHRSSFGESGPADHLVTSIDSPR